MRAVSVLYGSQTGCAESIAQVWVTPCLCVCVVPPSRRCERGTCEDGGLTRAIRPFPWQQIYNDALARQLDAALLPLNEFQKVRDLLAGARSLQTGRARG